MNEDTAAHYSAGKPRMDLLPPLPLEGVAAVLAHGAKKYADWNWLKGTAWSEYIGSAMRHINKFRAGEDIDNESGLPHIDHAICCLMFLSHYQKTGTGTDNRFK